jgi:hypothetical protein
MSVFHVTRRREVSWETSNRSYSRTRERDLQGWRALVLMIWNLVAFLAIVASAVMAIVGVFSVFIFAGVFAAVVIASRLTRFFGF